MARLFCGPDRSPWVQAEHTTPEATVAAFLEAVRRDQPAEVYRCLSGAFCKERGLDGMVVTAAWDTLRKQTPGLHLLGYAKVPASPARASATTATFEIAVDGFLVTLDLLRENYWELRYRGSDGRIRESSTRLDEAGYQSLLSAEPTERDPIDDLPQAKVGITSRTVVHPGAPTMSPATVERLEIGREWKISAIAVAER